MSYKLTPIKQTATADLTAAALSDTYTMAKDGFFHWAALKASVNITETVTVTFISADGSSYNIVLDTADLGGSSSNYFYNPSKKIFLKKGDGIKITCTFANTTGSVFSTLFIEENESWIH